MNSAKLLPWLALGYVLWRFVWFMDGTDRVLTLFGFAGAAICVLLWTHMGGMTHRLGTRRPAGGFVAWYRSPHNRDRVYLMQSDLGWQYATDYRAAHVFLTYGDARAALPVYDGGGTIEERTGVISVSDLQANRWRPF